MPQRSLQPILAQTRLLHEELTDLWVGLPDPDSQRPLLVTGFCEIVRQHVASQAILAEAEIDVTATTLVRPTFEALVRAIWCMGCASDDWIMKFLSPNPDALASDAETAMGPPVPKMLDEIQAHHPGQIHESLLRMKQYTWRAMHSYVHGGIRPFMQGLSGFREHEVAGVVMNANGMLLLATNLLRMSRGVRSPQLPELQKKYAACLPPPNNGAENGANP